MRERKRAEIRYVQASMANAAFTPTAATSGPPSAGPRKMEVEKVPLIMPFARVRSPVPTTLGNAARIVGLKCGRRRPEKQRV
jgi:hypothetical protein